MATSCIPHNSQCVGLVLFGLLFCSGCPISSTGEPQPGSPGRDGAAGISCWDLNENGIRDPEENVNDDNSIDVNDCEGPPGESGERGEDGADGEQGLSGDFGPAGAQGEQGPSGPPGPAGAAGVQGEQGPTGATGPEGATGRDAATTVVSTALELYAALDKLPTVGGRILILEGIIELDRTWHIDRNNIIIEGMGAGTIFRAADQMDCPVILVGSVDFAPSTATTDVHIRNLSIDGNRFNQTTEVCGDFAPTYITNNGITMREVSDCSVENVNIHGARSGGIVLAESCDNVVLNQIIAEDNEFDGIAWDGDITNSSILNSTCRQNIFAGLSFDIGPTGNLVLNSFFVDNGRGGVFMRDSRFNVFSNCVIANNGEDGVFIADGDAPGANASNNWFDGVVIRNNVRHGIWQNGENSVNNVVDGALFCGNGGNDLEEPFPATAPLVVHHTVSCP